MKSSDAFDRPELIDSDVWYHDEEDYTRTVLYADIDGESPFITNHISEIAIDVVAGKGMIFSGAIGTSIETGGQLQIKPETPYRYLGKMSLLVTVTPALTPAFVTFNQEPLAEEQSKFLKRYRREQRIARRLEGLNSRLEQFVAIAASSQSSLSWHDGRE